MKLSFYKLSIAQQDQWGFSFSMGSLNGARPVQDRRSPATVSEGTAKKPRISVADLPHKPENPPLINIPRTFARKGQDYDGISIATLYPVSRMKGFLNLTVSV